MDQGNVLGSSGGPLAHLRVEVIHLKWDELIRCAFLKNQASILEYRHGICQVWNLIKVWGFSRWVQGKRGKGFDRHTEEHLNDGPRNLRFPPSFYKCFRQPSCIMLNFGDGKMNRPSTCSQRRNLKSNAMFPKLQSFNMPSYFCHICVFPMLITVFINYIYFWTLIHFFEKECLCVKGKPVSFSISRRYLLNPK